MADQYGAAPTFPDGEPITAGPFNAEQAPSMECQNCKTPITVGQDFCVTYRYKLGCGAQTGRLIYLRHAESNTLDQAGQMIPFVYHDDCAAEWAHDEVTKEPCGDEDDNECEFCENPIPDGYRCCGICAERMGIPR